MFGHDRVRAATLGRLVDGVKEVEGVELRHLPPFSTLIVRTRNSVYRIVVAQWPEVYIQGGAFFPDVTSGYLDGASIGGTCLRIGWIGIDFSVEIRSGDRRIITSPVRGLTTVNGPNPSWLGASGSRPESGS